MINMKYVLFFSFLFLILCENAPGDIACTEQFVYGLNITVKDANTSNIIIENITVIAQEGEYEETLMNIDGANNFIGAGERSGSYIIQVTGINYQDFTSEMIVVDADECHVIPEILEILLQPN